MSYKRIQQILAADPVFAPQLAVADTEVIVRGEKTQVPALVANTFKAIQSSGVDMQSVARTTVLATASMVATAPTEVPTPVAPPPPPPPVVVAAPKTKPEPKPLQSTSKPVVVTTARAGSQRQDEKPIDTAIIHRYQCAIAGAQLLAALHQLFEMDDFPGHEKRKQKLDDLISEVEEASSTHVNLSVKALICAKSKIKAQS